MSKKIIAVNAGPRMGWNTETLITEASNGARAAERNGSNKKNGPRGYPQGAIESGLVTLFGIFCPNN